AFLPRVPSRRQPQRLQSHRLGAYREGQADRARPLRAGLRLGPVSPRRHPDEAVRALRPGPRFGHDRALLIDQAYGPAAQAFLALVAGAVGVAGAEASALYVGSRFLARDAGSGRRAYACRGGVALLRQKGEVANRGSTWQVVVQLQDEGPVPVGVARRRLKTD